MQIQIRHGSSDAWHNINDPEFDSKILEYRIAPIQEPTYQPTEVIKQRREEQQAINTAMSIKTDEELGEMFKGVEEMPSMGICLNAYNHSKTLTQGVEAVRNIMLTAFTRQMKEIQAKLDKKAREFEECTDLVQVADEKCQELREKLAAAEKRLEEIAKLLEKWKLYVSAETCITELRQVIKPTPAAEEIERAEFEEAYLLQYPAGAPDLQKQDDGSYRTPSVRCGFKMWQHGRASKEVKV